MNPNKAKSKGFNNFIRNPNVIWYGPFECSGCGQTIVRPSRTDGGVALNAPHDHHYPNHKWTKHVCPARKKVGEIKMDGKTHKAYLGHATDCPASSGKPVCTCGPGRFA